jgi:hypothetical protein
MMTLRARAQTPDHIIGPVLDGEVEGDGSIASRSAPTYQSPGSETNLTSRMTYRGR